MAGRIIPIGTPMPRVPVSSRRRRLSTSARRHLRSATSIPATTRHEPPTTIGPMTALHISADHARRFLVQRHLLAPPRALPAEPESVLTVVERLGLLQFDPL